MFDSHVHSNFSGDSHTPAEQSCQRAIEKGLKGLIFTDHLDLDYPHPDPAFDINLEDYSKFMDALKNKYCEDFKVFKGIEVGFQQQVLQQSLEIVQKYDFDFIIASVHVIDGMDPYYGGYFEGKTKHQAFFRYLETIYDSIIQFKDYDIVGHIGYIRRYGHYDDRTLRYADFSDILDAILKVIISSGKGLEINTSGYRSHLKSPMPDFDIITRYKELGGEIITLGSDAHDAEQVGANFDQVQQALKHLGVKYITHFENRKPVFDNL